MTNKKLVSPLLSLMVLVAALVSGCATKDNASQCENSVAGVMSTCTAASGGGLGLQSAPTDKVWPEPEKCEDRGDRVDCEQFRNSTNPDFRATRFRTTYRLDTNWLADKVAETGKLDVNLTEGKHVTLWLSETQLFAPGERKVVYENETGARTEEPLDLRTFAGVVDGHSNSTASMVISNNGLHGSVLLPKERPWSFQMAKDQDPSNPPGVVTQEVSRTVPGNGLSR